MKDTKQYFIKHQLYLLQLTFVATGMLFFFIQHAAAQKTGKQKLPNVIYIYADDLGYGELGSYGQAKIKTPNLDQLAREGIRFTQHYTGAPVCAPARCMLMTGKHAGHSYIRGNYEAGGFPDSLEAGQMPLPEGTFTIGRLMQQAGYRTAAIGKWGMGMYDNTGNPNKQGFDYFFGYLDQKQSHNYYPTHLWENGKRVSLRNEYFSPHQQLAKIPEDESVFKRYKGNEYAPDVMTSKALSFISENRQHPFFLYLAFTLPHVSLQVPDKALSLYTGQFSEQPYLGQQGYLPNQYPLSTYAAMITLMDDYIGQVMKLIKQTGLDENTIIMFSSDNGPTFHVGGVNAEFFNSTAGLRGRKMDLYEGGIRIPFIARWPGKIKAGKVSNRISAQFDIMNTLAELTAVKVPLNDGVSLLPELLGKDNGQKPHAYLYFEYPENNGQVAVRLGKWKGIKRNMKSNIHAQWEVYDLEKDVEEAENVAAANPGVIKRFEDIIKKEHQHPHINEWEFIDSKLK